MKLRRLAGWSDQSLVPAAACVADSCPLLDSSRVAPLVLQIQDTKGHVLGGDAIVLFCRRDAPLPSGCLLKRPQQHIGIYFLIYEQIDQLPDVLLSRGGVHGPARVPPVGTPAGRRPLLVPDRAV